MRAISRRSSKRSSASRRCAEISSVFDFSRAGRQAAALRETEHRPWPLPAERWLQGQSWENLLFAHWRVAASALEALVPPGLQLDRHEGAAWLGMTPFRLEGLRLRGMLPVPRLSSFFELNVRTYVTVEGRPGIFFFSLDASSALAVEGARRLYRLPYHRARMSAELSGDRVTFSSERREASTRPYAFRARYWPSGDVFFARPGTLEYFLTERYCLYVVDEGRVHRAEIHHAPWPLRRAEGEIELNTMAPDGLEVPGEAPLLHFASRQDVVVWPLEVIGERSPAA